MNISNLDKHKFIALLEEWHSHRVYYPETVATKLAECGLALSVAPDGKAVLIEGIRVEVTEPDWGDPGISPLSLLWTVYEITVGTRPDSRMTGRGFWYRDVIAQLCKHWNIPHNGA